MPNLLICLREGLEAGLVVTILLAAVRRLSTPERPVSTTPVWLGVLGAVSVAGSFAAVLTYSTAVLTSSARAAVAGVLSVLAVALVTAMIFWMRRTGASLSGQLRGEVARAAGVGAGVLAVTAFLAVGREGLETTLFVWTAIKAAGSTVAPLVGAALGLVLALALCWLLFRRAVRLNLGVFFNRTAVLLIVIAAGVLAYGLGDLQEAGWLPGARWIAFDLSAHVDPNSWWVSIITGVTNLSPKMTVLQVVAWIAYLATVIPLFLRAGQPTPATAPQPAATPDAQPTLTRSRKPNPCTRIGGSAWPVPARSWSVRSWCWSRCSRRLPPARCCPPPTPAAPARSPSPPMPVPRSGLRPAPAPGPFRCTMPPASPARSIWSMPTARSPHEIENIGPGTTAELTATLNPGSYTIVCLMSGRPALSSARVRATGPQTAAPLTFKQVRTSELRGPNDAYQDHVRQALTRLTAAVATVGRDLKANNIPAAQADWLLAQQEWERVGASYNSFGDAGTAVDGLPGGLPGGVEDPDFTGLHRLEYGLWHGQGPDRLLPVVDKLGVDIAAIGDKLTSTELAGDPATLPVRAHEILEDALRDHFSGLDDQGGGAAYPMTLADVEVTRVILDRLGPLLDQRDPKLRPDLAAKLDKLRAALLATQDNGRWRAPAQTPPTARQAVIAATGGALEALSRVPRLLETRAN